MKEKDKRRIKAFTNITMLFVLPIIFCSCTINKERLHKDWYPIKYIVERPSLPFSSDLLTTTVGTKIYVVDIEKWKLDYPEGKIWTNDLIGHEVVHSARQTKMGVKRWITKYTSDKSFRLYEEKLGYYVAIRRKFMRGWRIDISRIAQNLADHYGAMITKEDAEVWIKQVISTEWKPKQGDLPRHQFIDPVNPWLQKP